MDILIKIAEDRKKRIEKEGANQGLNIPSERELPLCPFGDPENRSNGRFVIAEVKKKSPSKGVINDRIDPAAQAAKYIECGATHISVLTEEAYFGGSLNDLIAVKKAHPNATVLRKDFLFTIEDVDISYRVGADAFLLIASLLDKDTITKMYNRGIELGMTPLVELHDQDDADKVIEIKPKFTGINCRDLRTFKIDPFKPLKTRNSITWDANLVYESGIKSEKDARFARDTGFSGLLVGESFVRDPNLAKSIVSVFTAESDNFFTPYSKLFSFYRNDRAMVKVCGLTNSQDVALASQMGADLLGFILAESPRQVKPSFVQEMSYDQIKVAVVVPDKEGNVEDNVYKLIQKGAIDFVQFHGEVNEKHLNQLPGYMALRVNIEEQLNILENPPTPAILLDAYSEKHAGGTGKLIDDALVRKARLYPNLWLAGGLNPENIGTILETYEPELVDLSSGIELVPGRKSPEKMKMFFEKIYSYAENKLYRKNKDVEIFTI